MPEYVRVVVPATLSKAAAEQVRAASQRLADIVLEPVVMAIVDGTAGAAVDAALARSGGTGYLLRPASAAPMGAAPFVWGADGTPDWSAMWTTFCELALYGGPPHRSADRPVLALADTASSSFDAVAEIVRGIRATTGLEAIPIGDGWVRIECASVRMAAWLCATILLENVIARCEGRSLYLPAAAAFTLEDQVKSVITVLAKTYHYYRAHLEEEECRAPRAS
ncbi:MAG: hypothetical protein FJ034_08695 [Chloroflexi bacterium]|nr:hypothetical protein [Chloroflexota bacterium]